jgi:hypothetical protein
MLKKITKRDQQFDKKLKVLPKEWFDYDPFLTMVDKHYGLAEIWKFRIYHIQQDAVRSLIYANSNQHPSIGHEVVRDSDKIVFSSQILRKAYFLRYAVLLLQACGDKLAQLLRCAMKIETWRVRGKNDIKEYKAKENNTSLNIIHRHLKLNEAVPHPIFSAIDSYLCDENVIAIISLANKIKHKWHLPYQGEGLHPVNPPSKLLKDKTGKIIGETIGICAMTTGISINDDIKHALLANNAFVDMANGINEILDFDKFYEFKDGKKILVDPLTKESTE